jgi:hypothetical protein
MRGWKAKFDLRKEKKNTVRKSPEQSSAQDHQQVVFNDYMHESVSNGLCMTVEKIVRSGR